MEGNAVGIEKAANRVVQLPLLAGLKALLDAALLQLLAICLVSCSFVCLLALLVFGTNSYVLPALEGVQQ